jgi:hypothetical protein
MSTRGSTTTVVEDATGTVVLLHLKAEVEIRPRTKIVVRDPFLSIQDGILCLCVIDPSEIGEYLEPD